MVRDLNFLLISLILVSGSASSKWDDPTPKELNSRAMVIDEVIVRYWTIVDKIERAPEKLSRAITTAPEKIKLVDGIFLAIGHDPASGLFKEQLATSEEGHLQLLPGTQQTSCPGVFAAGEVCDAVYRRAGVAAGEGMRVALDSIKFLQEVGA
jgi:thioredoxin reductase